MCNHPGHESDTVIIYSSHSEDSHRSEINQLVFTCCQLKRQALIKTIFRVPSLFLNFFFSMVDPVAIPSEMNLIRRTYQHIQRFIYVCIEKTYSSVAPGLNYRVWNSQGFPSRWKKREREIQFTVKCSSHVHTRTSIEN